MSSLERLEHSIDVDDGFDKDAYILILSALQLDYPEVFWTQPSCLWIDPSNVVKRIDFTAFKEDVVKRQCQQLKQDSDSFVQQVKDEFFQQEEDAPLRFSLQEVAF